MQLSRTEEHEIQQALAVLRKGGLILYPTDTIWGIGCDAGNTAAVERIFKLKKREESKSLILLLDSEEKLMKYVKEVPEQAWSLIEFSSKPLTIIYDKAVNVSERVIATDGSVGIRITKDPFCRQLIYKLNKPLVSTSANISGEEAPSIFHDISPEVLNGVDYVVNLRQNESDTKKPSVILKLNSKGHIQFIRK
jgi:L-threonylcarbamoyladenylate synthase